MDEDDKTFLLLKYGSLDACLALWLSDRNLFSEEEQRMIEAYSKEILPNLHLTRYKD
jgi:hypothetical protein